MKRPRLARLPILITANVLGALLALVAILGAISVLAGPAAAPQLVTIPDCGDCNVIVVAKDGGNFTDPIAAMAHIAAQTPDSSNRFLLYIGPGTYPLSEPLQMLEHVDIQGAGEGITTLTRIGGSINAEGGSTVVGADNAELRFLTVESTGGVFAIGIFTLGASPKLSHVTATGSGATSANFGVYIAGGSAPIMTDVTATATGGSFTSAGVFNTGSSPVMSNVTATASGSTGNYGVYNSSSSPIMTNVTATGSGGTHSYGVYNFSSSSPIMTDVTATGSGSGFLSVGVSNSSGASPFMTNVTATGSGSALSAGVYNGNSSSPIIRSSRIKGSGGGSNFGIYNTGTAGIVIVDASQVIGATATIKNENTYIVKVGSSLLDGGAISGAGTFVCAASYDEDYKLLSTSCT